MPAVSYPPRSGLCSAPRCRWRAERALGCGRCSESRWQAPSAATAHSSSTLGSSSPPMITKYAADHNSSGGTEHRRELLFERPVMLLPVARLGEPGKSLRKGRVVPAARQPGGIVDHAQRAQRLDQRDFAAIERQELLVALEQIGAIPCASPAGRRRAASTGPEWRGRSSNRRDRRNAALARSTGYCRGGNRRECARGPRRPNRRRAPRPPRAAHR